MSHSEHLEKEMFETEYGVTGMVKEKSRAYENTFSLGIAGGVGEGLLIKHGEIVKRVKQEDMVQTLKDEILKMVEEKSE